MRIMELLTGSTFGSGVGQGKDWDPHQMGPAGSIPPFIGGARGSMPNAPAPMTPPTGPGPSGAATPPANMQMAANPFSKDFWTTAQPIGGDQPKPETSSVGNSIAHSSLNPFAPVNNALEKAAGTVPGQVQTK